MPSKQMACQLNPSQMMGWAKKILQLAEEKGSKYDNFGELLDAEIADPKARVRLGTSLVVLHQLSQDNMSAHDILNVIRWRNDKGDAGEIEIHYSKIGKQKRAIKVAELRRWADIREVIRFIRPLG